MYTRKHASHASHAALLDRCSRIRLDSRKAVPVSGQDHFKVMFYSFRLPELHPTVLGVSLSAIPAWLSPPAGGLLHGAPSRPAERWKSRKSYGETIHPSALEIAVDPGPPLAFS